jgi:glycosyltransferase involved in cell wall biosynthesis
VYNAEKYLHRCLSSIIGQTYGNLEIILVNDGSLDNSLTICNKYAKKDSRILVIDKENGGISSARNRGLEIAIGDYIGFVDSDDYISPDMYAKLLEAIKSDNADIVECELSDALTVGSYQCSYEFLAGINTMNPVWNRLYRRFLFDNIRFSGYAWGEDYVANAQIAYICSAKVTISDHLYHYINNKNSTTRVPFSLAKMNTINTGKEVFDFYHRRYENLCPYISVYICNYLLECYIGLLRSDEIDRKRYMKEIVNDYRIYYPKIPETVFKTVKLWKRRIHYTIFRVSPALYSLLIAIFGFGRRLRRKFRI